MGGTEMKRVTDVLRDEHRLITRAAACLDRLVDYALDTDDLCVVSAMELLEFFEDFADDVHQEKEERNLFPAMLAAGLAPQRVHALLDEHRRERASLSIMRENLEGAAYGNAFRYDRFVKSAAEFAALQRAHAEEEEEVLLPLAEELLDDRARAEVLAGFERTEAELLTRPLEHYVTLVTNVATRLGSAVPADSQLLS
jgi:hemerythrin-like domain-containing protein